jgi:lauroyl/myristoyl acyltransferase
VLRFEEALPLIKCENADEAIRGNTLAFNRALEHLVLRHPEQWHWMQRRWKPGYARAHPADQRSPLGRGPAAILRIDACGI